jgi:single-stranded DNA-binding protein
MIEGRLQHRSYLGADGSKREKSEVVVKNILLIEAKGKTVLFTETESIEQNPVLD